MGQPGASADRGRARPRPLRSRGPRSRAVLAKACTILGTSFAGVLAAEDLAAAAYLRSRPDIGSVSTIGLSGGGARAALLGALDPEIGAVAVAAMVSSFRDFRDEHVAAHSWMLFPPGLTRLADWPGVVAARAPPR